MTLPLELVQIIKEQADFRTARLMTSMGLGSLTQKEKLYKRAEYLWFNIEDIEKRVFGNNLYKGVCPGTCVRMCTMEEYAKFNAVHIIQDILQCTFPFYDSIDYAKIIDSIKIHQGPMLPICMCMYKKSDRY